MKRFLTQLSVFITLFWYFVPKNVSAHEAYVLPTSFFWSEIFKPIDVQAFSVLRDPQDLTLTLKITAAVIVVILLNFLFRRSKVGERTHAFIERFAVFGPVLTRIAIAAAFFFGAHSGAFLGPELSLAAMPYAHVLQTLLYLASALILFGVFTEIGAAIGLFVFTVGFFVFGGYLVTYLNYLGELIALLLFGMRSWSGDYFLFGDLKKWRKRWEPYETTIIRVFYGFSLMYAGILVKFLHPGLTLRVVNDWHLTQFHWLFPSDPLLVVLGAGLAEAVIGLFIIFGFEMRITVLISLFYITLSLLYFQELVWPHILLYGISLNLLVQPEILTLDHLFFSHHRRKKSIFKRLLSSHR